MRTADGAGWRFNSNLPGELVQALNRLCQREPAFGSTEDPVLRTEALALLSDGTTQDPLWQGPVYAFPDRLNTSSSIALVSINQANGHLLQAEMSDWLPDVGQRAPFMAAIADDQAVAVCASVRIGQWIHEAGVETQPAYRGSGLGRAVVGAWAEAVRSLGAQPVYSTSRENEASQALAHSLGLKQIGSDFHIR